MRRLAWIALLYTACLPACGDDGGGDSPAADAATIDDSDGAGADADAAVPLTELDALCAEDGPIVELVLDAAECNPQISNFGYPETSFFTARTLAPLCRSWYDNFLDDGSVTVDESAIPACMDYLDAMPCESVGAFSNATAIVWGGSLEALRGTPCDLILVGSHEEQNDCDISAQCAGDSYCGEPPLIFGAPNECSRCQPALANGDACTANQQCSSGLCNEDEECAAPAGLGDSCTGHADCLVDFLCDDVTSECVRRKPEAGTPCAGNQDCGSYVLGLYCDAADTETCLPFPEVGESCVSTGDIRCNIDGYNWCNTNENVCALPEIVQAGEPCNVFAVIDAGARRCADGLACSSPGATDDDGFALGRCFVPRQLGESCGVVGDGTDACSFINSCTDNVCVVQLDPYTGQCTGGPPSS